MHRLITKADRMAARWAPAGSTEVRHPDGLGVVFLYGDDKPCAIAYRGTAGRSEFHAEYRTVERRAAAVKEWFDSLTKRAQSVKQWRDTARARNSKTIAERLAEVPPGGSLSFSCAETAQVLRAELARRCPGVKFSIRSRTYSGGASIDVDYTDGPPAAQVKTICSRLEGSGFDGMIDLKYYVYHWMTPDGAICFADSPGTEGSRGVFPGYDHPAPSPDARRVHFGADSIHCHRRISPALAARIADQVEHDTGTRPESVAYDNGVSFGQIHTYSPESEHAARAAWALVDSMGA